jgi:hypothetical protein
MTADSAGIDAEDGERRKEERGKRKEERGKRKEEMRASIFFKGHQLI